MDSAEDYGDDPAEIYGKLHNKKLWNNPRIVWSVLMSVKDKDVAFNCIKQYSHLLDNEYFILEIFKNISDYGLIGTEYADDIVRNINDGISGRLRKDSNFQKDLIQLKNEYRLSKWEKDVSETGWEKSAAWDEPPFYE